MTTQTRADAIEALVKALELYQEHDPVGCPESGCADPNCLMCGAGEALAFFRAKPALTREQVEQVVNASFAGHQPYILAVAVTDALLPLLEAAGAMEKPTIGYKAARGAIPYTPGQELPEVIIRRLRDGEDKEHTDG